MDGKINNEEAGLTAPEFVDQYKDKEGGLLIEATDLATGEKMASYLPPDGDYALFLGPDFYVSSSGVYPGTGTSQINIKRGGGGQ